MRRRIFKDRLIRYTFNAIALTTVVVLVGIFLMLLINGITTFTKISLTEFTGFTWNPTAYKSASYGMFSMIFSTIVVTLIAMLIAIPLGIGTAIYLLEFAPGIIRHVLFFLIELLAAIPSVTLGFLGIVLLAPVLAKTFHTNNGLNALNGSILLAIMSLPTIIAVSVEALRSVPQEYKEASFALGGNRWITQIRVIIPACYSGLIAAIMLGTGRAVGETMTVLMATGNATAFPDNILDSVRTMTATIAIELGEVPYYTTHYYALFAVGLVLFLITLATNIIAENIAVKFRRQGR